MNKELQKFLAIGEDFKEDLQIFADECRCWSDMKVVEVLNIDDEYFVGQIIDDEDDMTIGSITIVTYHPAEEIPYVCTSIYSMKTVQANNILELADEYTKLNINDNPKATKYPYIGEPLAIVNINVDGYNL